MKAAWPKPIRPAPSQATPTEGAIARTQGARPLSMPTYRNSRPLVTSPLMPARVIAEISAPSPTSIISVAKPAPCASRRSSERTGNNDSNDIVKPQWKNAMPTMARRAGV